MAELTCFTSKLAYTRQGSGLIPFLYIIVLDVISKKITCGLLCELLFADDLAVVTDTEEEMQRSWLGCQIGIAKL